MKDKIKFTEFGKRIYARGVYYLKRDENVIKVFNLDDDALYFSSLNYYYFSNHIQSSKSFEAVLKNDLKRIEIFKEKFDLEKFKQRSKKYKKFVDYWHKKFNEFFIDLIEILKKYMKIDYVKIPNDHPVDYTGFTDNLVIVLLYTFFLESNARSEYCFDKYFDRFDFNYDIDIKTIKGEIDSEIIKVFIFNKVSTFNLEGTLTIEKVERLIKNFGSGRQLLPTKETKYKLVAEYITIMEKHFKISTGIQRIACELAGVIQYSFSAWKNAKNQAGEKKNFDTFLKWKKEKIPAKRVESLKTKVVNFLKST